MAVVDQLLQLFAGSIFAKVSALKSLELTRNQRKRLRSSITAEIRACGGLLYPEILAPEVSEAALQEADRIGVNICAQTWHSQSSFDAGRKVFHLEHVDPIACIQETCEEAGYEGAVLEILRTRLRIAWILKREDWELTRLGFRSKRPDPEGAYRAAKIVLIKRHGSPPNQTELQPAGAALEQAHGFARIAKRCPRGGIHHGCHPRPSARSCAK
jgi:hypothetical protein